MLGALEEYDFWSNSGARTLWNHQRIAIALALAHYAGDPKLPYAPGNRESALIKMPTGTGKTAIIAALARCVPQIKRVLIITPREALVSQMFKDVDHRQWERFGYSRSSKSPGSALRGSNEESRPIDKTELHMLLPSKAAEIADILEMSPRVVLVGTFTALSEITRAATKHRDKDAERLLKLLGARLNLIVVDEGHYEPATDWGRSVRALGARSVLFSATPYRNDFKYFNVRGSFVFNYPMQEAVKRRIVRDVTFIELRSSGNKNVVSRFVDGIVGFFDQYMTKAVVGCERPKLLIRGDTLEDLITIQTLLVTRFKTRAIVVHDRIRPNDAVRFQFGSVDAARRADEASAPVDRARIWIHDTKMLEGIDDDEFAGAALYAGFDNARQLVQQVGRIIRSTDGKRKQLQHAFVTASESAFDKMAGMWRRYCAYERYCEVEGSKVVAKEANMPELLIELLPSMQYIDGDFRERFSLDSAPEADDLRLRATGAVFEDFTKGNTLDELADEILDQFLDADRFEARRVANTPGQSIVITYFAWKNSPYVANSFFPEWVLGVFALFKAGEYVFLLDTEGLVLDKQRLPMKRVDAQILRRAFPEGSDHRITQLSFISLDMSERSIRSQATRARSFADTFTDLSDPALVPTTAAGFVAHTRRYIGLRRARITDDYGDVISLKEYAEWVEGVAEVLGAKGKGSPIFDRYAKLAKPPNGEDGKPLSILFDFTDSIESLLESQTPSDGADIEYDDLSSEITDGACTIRIAGQPYAVEVTYRQDRGMYRIKSAQLDQYFQEQFGADEPGSLTARLNREQSFRIVTKGGFVYAHQYFYQPTLRFHSSEGTSPLLANVFGVAALSKAVSEKGEKFYDDQDKWKTQSVFGIISRLVEAPSSAKAYGQLGKDLKDFDTVICTDATSNEIADFILVSFDRRKIAFVHAKASKEVFTMGVTKLQEVGRQAQASLAYAATASATANLLNQSWSENLRIEPELDLPRVFKSRIEDIAELINEVTIAMADVSWNREVWIVLGSILNLTVMNERLNREDPRPLDRQFGYYIDSIRTVCGRGNAQLRIYCPDELPDEENRSPESAE